MSMIATRLAWIAGLLAAAAAAIGLFTPVYRDVPAMVDQARGTDLATLFAAAPLLLVSLWIGRGGSPIARVAAGGALGYLAYTYAIYAFQVVVNPMTPVHIAVLGLAAWSLGLGIVGGGTTLREVGTSLPRRTTAAFLTLVVVLFGGLWLGQIGGAITSGVLPTAVSDLSLPTSAVYALDLAFALPVLALGAVWLYRGVADGPALALGGLVFVVLMALSILGLFAVEAVNGTLTDASIVVVFAIVGAIGAVLAIRGTGRRHVVLTAFRTAGHGRSTAG